MTKKINLKQEQLSNINAEDVKDALLDIKEKRQALKSAEDKHKALLNDAKEVLELSDSLEGDGYNITMKIVNRKAYKVKASILKRLDINIF